MLCQAGMNRLLFLVLKYSHAANFLFGNAFWINNFAVTLKSVFIRNLVLLLDGKTKHKFWALSVLGLESDVATKFLHDHFAYDEAKSDSICIRLVFETIVGAKESENLGLIFFLYANSRILHKYFDEAILLIDGLHLNGSIPLSKFDGVWEQVEEDLGKSVLVRNDELGVFEAANTDFKLNIFEFNLIF